MMKATQRALFMAGGPPPVAVLLSGCGVYDGAEIHESVSTLIHLNQRGQPYKIFAPNMDQGHVIDHQHSSPAEGQTRNVMTEAARIARGPVHSLEELDVSLYQSLVMPGGFGVMKNLSNFAFHGKEGAIRDDVANAIRGFHTAKKPIGAACIAPMMLAAALGTRCGGPGCQITMGAASGDAHELATFLGAEHVERGKVGLCVDAKNLIVSTPAYMCDVGPAEVFEGIGKMVEVLVAMPGLSHEEVVKLASKH